MSTDAVPDQPPASAPPPAAPAHRPPDLFAAVLSYLVPGLGQIYQGRFAKGLLFLVALWGMFFFGMHLGSWKNVYIFETKNAGGRGLGAAAWSWVDRVRFVGQAPIGIAAWPAILQYNGKWPVTAEQSPFWHEFQSEPDERLLNALQAQGDKRWDLGWVYTVIAGVLNILVIYDALAGPAFVAAAAPRAAARTEETPPALVSQEVAS